MNILNEKNLLQKTIWDVSLLTKKLFHLFIKNTIGVVKSIKKIDRIHKFFIEVIITPKKIWHLKIIVMLQILV